MKQINTSKCLFSFTHSILKNNFEIQNRIRKVINRKIFNGGRGLKIGESPIFIYRIIRETLKVETLKKLETLWNK